VKRRVVRVCSLTATLPLGPRLWLRLHTLVAGGDQEAGP
jgi:hypothetical protein